MMDIFAMIEIGHVLEGGVPLKDLLAKNAGDGKVLVMLHGRGSTAQNIMTIARSLRIEGYAVLAPQAFNNTWYPYSFLSPESQNEPHLSRSLNWLTDIEQELNRLGVTSDRIYFLGFSQGACLSLEYTARNAKRYGGIAAFSGGLIGDGIYPGKYTGDFKGSPIFLGSSDPDPHIPVERVKASGSLLQDLGAEVRVKIYTDMGHTIIQDEIDIVNEFVFH